VGSSELFGSRLVSGGLGGSFLLARLVADGSEVGEFFLVISSDEATSGNESRGAGAETGGFGVEAGRGRFRLLIHWLSKLSRPPSYEVVVPSREVLLLLFFGHIILVVSLMLRLELSPEGGERICITRAWWVICWLLTEGGESSLLSEIISVLFSVEVVVVRHLIL